MIIVVVINTPKQSIAARTTVVLSRLATINRCANREKATRWCNKWVITAVGIKSMIGCRSV